MIDSSAVQPYNKVLIKLSGELLGGDRGLGIDADEIDRVAGELAGIVNAGIKTGVVVGGGNFFRGGRKSGLSISKVRGHQMGMLFTIPNAIALEQTLRSKGVGAVVQSAVAVPSIVEQYDATSFADHLDNDCIVIFAGGTGSTHFTTDTAASLRAIEMGADILLKATNVDGIYSADPKNDTATVRFEMLTHNEILEKNLAVMDATSIALCREHNLPIRVFDGTVKGSIERVGLGSQEGTLVIKE